MPDESIGSFLSRRFDKRLANNIASAVMHGIYAGDIWQLSAKTLLSQAWQLEGRYGNVIGGMFRMNQEVQGPEQIVLWHPYDLDTLKMMRDEIRLDGKLLAQLGDASMFTFRNGLQTLVKALQRNLEGNPQVEIRLGSVRDYKMAGGQRVEVVTGVCLPLSPFRYGS